MFEIHPQGRAKVVQERNLFKRKTFHVKTVIRSLLMN